MGEMKGNEGRKSKVMKGWKSEGNEVGKVRVGREGYEGWKSEENEASNEKWR